MSKFRFRATSAALRHMNLPADIPPRQFEILELLAHTEEGRKITVGWLAKTMQVSKPVISRSLNTLSAHGLASRERDSRDRRSVLCSILQKGKDLLACIDAFEKVYVAS